MDLESVSTSSVGLLCLSPPVGACSVSGLRVSNTHSLWLSAGKSRKSRLRLNEYAKQRTAGWGFRAKIAYETVLRANLDMPGRATGVVNQDGTNRCLIRIRHWQFMEA